MPAEPGRRFGFRVRRRSDCRRHKASGKWSADKWRVAGQKPKGSALSYLSSDHLSVRPFAAGHGLTLPRHLSESWAVVTPTF